jgi:hypothetical protein
MHKSHKSTNFLMMLLACALIFALATPALSREEPVGKLTDFSGAVIIKSKGSWASKPSLNLPLYSSDKVVTQLGRATIVFNDGLVIKVANNSNLLIKEQVEKKTVKRRLRLILGKLSFKTGKSKDKRETIFETPTAVCAIRGTAGTLSVEWKGGKLQGKGTSTFADGSKYVGEFKNGKLLHEQGTLTLADGAKYVGEWKNGKRNGQGTITYPNGEKRVGEFKDGKYVGKLRVSRE